MTTDFNYNNKTIDSSGPIKPSGKNQPLDPRTEVKLYADIETIPNPYVGMIITVLEDETNQNKMTDYKVLSLKPNSLGIANSVIDQVQRYVDYLGVSTGGSVDLSGYATKDELNTKANTSDIPTNTSELYNDSGFLTSIPSEYVTETEMNEAIANVSSGGSVSQEDISTAVNNYLTEHPVTGGATAEQANQIEANKTNIATLKELVGDSSSGLVKAVTDNASQLDTKASKDVVAKISSGTPLFASSITEMTDNTRNYVNTTDGYVYVYNGTNFEKTSVKYLSSNKQSTVKNLGGLINESYSLNPKSFITWNNTKSSTIKNNGTLIDNYLKLNAVTNLGGGTHYLNSININNPAKTKYTFSCLMKLNSGVKPFVDIMDNNNKYYRINGGVENITENYYGDYSLVTFTFNVTTNITKLVVLIGYTGTSDFDIGMFSLWEGNNQLEIIDSDTVTYEKLDNELKGKIDKIGINSVDVLNYDMLLPKKLFMIKEEPLRLYKKNIIVNADNIRDLELSVTSYNDDSFWNNSKQPYVEYIGNKIELKSENVIGNKIKFNLVGNDLKTRLGKEVEIVSRSKADVSGKSIVVNMFGDSTSQNGLTYAVNKLLSYYVTRKLIGTKTVNGTAAEARGGWLYQQYIGYRTTYSNNNQPIDNADFPNFLKLATDDDKTNKGDWCFTRTGSSREKTYNEIVSEGGDTSQNFYIFDYAHYLQTNGFENPDFVTLGMGINDYWKYPDDATQLCERALNIIIKQIHEASPNTKFIIQPFPTKGSNDMKSEWFKKCLELETYFRDTVGVDIEIVAEHLSQNKDLFFPTTKSSLDGKISDKEIINDDIHTTLAGYSEGARPIVYCILNKID